MPVFYFLQIIIILCAFSNVLLGSERAHCLSDILAKLSQKKNFVQNLVEHCKGQTIETMTHIFNYKSQKNKREHNVHDKMDGFMAGANGEIFIGYIGNREKCVAIKLIKLDDPQKIRIFENSVLVMNKIQKKLSQRERHHIIELIDYGRSIVKPLKGKVGSGQAAEFSYYFSDDVGKNRDDETEYGVLIMELGTETFGEKIYEDRTDYSANDNCLTNVISQLVFPLRELHKVAMHLDYKPNNLIYVELPEESQILKVIDFDGTYLLEENVPKEQKGKMANSVSNKLKIFTGTNRYNAPEFYAKPFEKNLSTKTDNWAVGMMIYEILFLQKKYGIYEKMENNKETFYNLLYHVNQIHRGFVVTQEHAKYIHQQISAEWLTNFKVEILFCIFQTWKDFPKVGLLITNLLNVVPTKRMSAKGIMAFLNGECCPDEVYDEKSEIGKIFNGLSVEELNTNIDNRVKTVQDLEEQSKLKEMKRMLRKALVKRLEIAGKLRLFTAHCDTVTTGN